MLLKWYDSNKWLNLLKQLKYEFYKELKKYSENKLENNK